MALLATYLQDIRSQYPSNNDRDQLRITRTGLLTAVLDMTNSPDSIISPDLQEKAIASEGRNLDIPVMKKGTVTITNVRSCTISGPQSDSALVRVVWKTIVANILMVPSQYEKNIVKYPTDLAKKIREIVEAFKVEIETDLETALDANKSQVYNSAIVGGTYGFVGDAIQVLPTQLQYFFNDLEPINFADDFYNPTIKVIANHTVMPVVTRYINQGGGNAENTNFQFAGKDFTFSNRILNGVLIDATGYFMPDGSMALLTREDVDARMNHEAGTTKWTVENLPELPFPVGVKYNSQCDDKSALEASGLDHLTATKVEHWQISVDYGIIVPYNPDIATTANSIRKFEFIPAP